MSLPLEMGVNPALLVNLSFTEAYSWLLHTELCVMANK